MFNFLINLFRRSAARRAANSRKSAPFGGESPIPVPCVETVRLSLTTLLAKFSDDLSESIQQWPDSEVTIALPVPTILKQLPNGSVKMSLASVYRQAPAGVFKPGSAEEKRMVEVPLNEVFKHIRLESLKRRANQRRYNFPEHGINLFGDKENPFAISPTVPPEEVAPAKPAIADEQSSGAPGATLKLQQTVLPHLPAQGVPASGALGSVTPPAEVAASVQSSANLKLASQPTPAELSKPAKIQSGPAFEQTPLMLAIGELAAHWPEPIKSEVAAMNGAQVALPTGDVAEGLAKGKVAFTWGQICAWLTPEMSSSAAPESIELLLPLRVVAPAFLKHAKHSHQLKQGVEIGEEIPELFRSSEGPTTKPPESLSEEPSTPAEASVQAPVEAQLEPIENPAVRVVEAPVTQLFPAPLAHNIGELFGRPDKAQWSPAEIVHNVCALRQIDGAIVVLPEGLVVAHHLPEDMKCEVFAAFLPQVFTRLNQYAGEMNLGEIDDLVISARGAHCQIFRLDRVLFAVLGKPGEPLPIHELRLCASELAK